MASDKNEIKRMVMSFHIPELQILLGILKLNKYGRKAELMQRAIAAVARGIPPSVQEEIRELYRRKFASRQYLPEMDNRVIKPPLLSQQSLPQPLYFPQENVFSNLMSMPTSHVNTSIDRMMPIQPDVRLKALPFYDTMAELLKPSTLLSRSTSGLQEAYFSFHLTPLQTQEVNLSRDVQVQLRICLVETSCEQEDKFPSGINVRVNGKPAQLPPPIPTNKLGVEPKRPGRPVNVTPQCHLSPAAPNHITVNWNPEMGRIFCVSVYLVTQLNSDILLHRLKQNGISHSYHTRALVKEKLAVDLDSEIATTSLRISLICPLGKVRMRVPCRASSCSHLQCFDAPTYIQMNEKKPTWICPICDKPAEFKKLIIDGLFTDILNKETACTEIQFTEDGNWKPSKPDSEECWVPDSPPAAATCSDKVTSNSVREENPVTKPAEAIEMIDLTESDDEDEGRAKNQSPWMQPMYAGSDIPELQMPELSLAGPVGSATSLNVRDHHQSLLCSSSANSRSPSAVITIDTPPPAHSPYSSLSSAHSPYGPSRAHTTPKHSGSGDGVSVRPPPAHSNSCAARPIYDQSWFVHRPVETSRDNTPLSLTLRRCPASAGNHNSSVAVTINSSSESSTSPFDPS